STSPSNSRLSQPSYNRPSQPSYSRPSQPYYNRPSQPSYQNQNPVYVPAPVYVPPPAYAPSQSSVRSESGGNGVLVGLVLLVVLIVGLIVLAGILQSFFANLASAKAADPTKGMNQREKAIWREINNDIITITRLQVALLAIASNVQRELSQLVADADLSTAEGLSQHLQDVVLVLLRTQSSWTHVRGSSQTVKTREEAERIFDEFSLAERSKLSAETLTNVGGKVKKRTAHLNETDGPASYIVVTLLVGTAHDKPLFSNVQTEAELVSALKMLTTFKPDYLLVFEVIWSPQDETDSLTQDELITEYSDLYQLA
ncbi:MAG: DUF1517 domain-containing protein, partial [Cyanobacteria bacterium]|nr:DUF1517 domain-containing protein [Cyanobacteriota bacterium]